MTRDVLHVTPQTWLSEEVVSRSQWWHVVVVIVPHNLRWAASRASMEGSRRFHFNFNLREPWIEALTTATPG